jgi:hypothetical protein
MQKRLIIGGIGKFSMKRRKRMEIPLMDAWRPVRPGMPKVRANPPIMPLEQFD